MKTYFINLTESQERLTDITSELSNLELDFERFNAYDVKTTKKYLKETLNKSFNSTKNDRWWRRLACKVSHIECIKEGIKNGHDRILVLEDDCTFREGFKEYFDFYFEEVPDDWSILFLGYFIKNKFNVKNQNVSYKVTDNIYTLTESHGAHAVAYNLCSPNFKRFFDAITSKFYLEKHYDLEIHEICNELDITRYAVYPQFVAQRNGFSYLSGRNKEWDLRMNHPRYDLLQSGTVYPYRWTILKDNTELEQKSEYSILLNGEEIKAKYINGYFVKPQNLEILEKPTYIRKI